MAGNLRDRGYPSAKSYKPDTVSGNTIVSNQTMPYGSAGFYSGTLDDSGYTNNRTALDKLITAYNNRAFGSNAPMISKAVTPYVDDETDSRSYLTNIGLRDRNNNRLGFVSENLRPGSTEYYAGVDNLPFGEEVFDRNITTPVGNFNLNYDGDGTASVGYESSPNVYYLQALAKALMSRGTL